MTPGGERIAIVLTPVLAMATFAVGLRVGAASPMRAAMIYGAPPSASRAGLAWQLITVREESGVREAVPMQGLHVIATARARGRASGEQRAEWSGATNADGTAEIWLDLPGVESGDAIELEVDAAGEKAPLAHGVARWQDVQWGAYAHAQPWVPPSKQEGDLAIDVAVYGQKVAPGFPTGLWARVQDKRTGQPAAGVALEAAPEPGLEVASTSATTCANGWAAFTVTAAIHVVGLALHASKDGASQGEWFGALPVAPGGSDVPLPTEVSPGTPLSLSVIVPTVRPLVYLEVDDVKGRAFGAALEVASGEGAPRAEVSIPPLPAGQYWVVTAGDPRGAETIAQGAVARPLLVRSGEPLGRCELGPALATVAGPFPKWLALDGSLDRVSAQGGKRRTGFLLAWGALGVAGVLEALLLVRAAARARRAMSKVAQQMADDDAHVPELSPRFGVANVAVGILLALLGFALVGALLTLRAQ